MLKITSLEENATHRLKLEGKLKNAYVLELENYWRTLDGGKKLVVDLTEVDYVDTAGKYLLALMYGRGARFTADSPMMKHLLAKVVGASKRFAYKA